MWIIPDSDFDVSVNAECGYTIEGGVLDDVLMLAIELLHTGCIVCQQARMRCPMRYRWVYTVTTYHSVVESVLWCSADACRRYGGPAFPQGWLWRWRFFHGGTPSRYDFHTPYLHALKFDGVGPHES